MQILLFVIAIMSALAILTYARLETFLSQSLLQNEYKKTIQISVQKQPNKIWDDLYDTYVGSTKDSSPSTEKKTNLSSKLYVGAFLNPTEAASPEFAGTRQVLQRLIHQLYSSHSFYQEFIQKQSLEGKTEEDTLDWLFETLMENRKKASEQKTSISDPIQLALIEVPDPLLRHFFIKMLEGAGSYNSTDANEAGQGIPSLADYISVKGSKKTGIYIAKKELLLAIFKDPRLVEEILLKRSEIRKLISSNLITQQAGAEVLQHMLGGVSYTGFDEVLLDFSITGTNPGS